MLHSSSKSPIDAAFMKPDAALIPTISTALVLVPFSVLYQRTPLVKIESAGSIEVTATFCAPDSGQTATAPTVNSR